jgi:hypothetical protein
MMMASAIIHACGIFTLLTFCCVVIVMRYPSPHSSKGMMLYEMLMLVEKIEIGKYCADIWLTITLNKKKQIIFCSVVEDSDETTLLSP